MRKVKEILTLECLEQRFLSVAPENGFCVNKLPNLPSDMEKTISQDMARADVAMLAQLLIQAYGGWPFYPKLLRRKILTVLLRIYDSISGPVKICELYERLKPIVAMMPDRHIMIVADKNPMINIETPINVGDNLVTARHIKEPYLIEKQGRIGIIALSRFFEPKDLEDIRQQVLNIMTKTDAIIVDLRNNGGGSMHIASMLGKTLSGFDLIPRSRRMFARNTPLARKLQQYITDFPAIKTIANNAPDPVMIVDNSKFKMSKNHKWAFGGKIYILVNNRSASSSETVIEYLKYNPNTKLIGTHTSGCNQYIHYRFIELARSGIHVRLPLVYKEIAHVKSQKFEMHGYAPDIECTPGTDAFKVAMDMIQGELL